MQFHELNVEQKKSRKRVGRGGRRGTYSGRGMNGQKARSGAPVDPLFEGGRSSLTERLKKIGGFKSHRMKPFIVQLSALEANFEDGELINCATLQAKKIVPLIGPRQTVKVLGGGQLKKKLTLGTDLLFSESVRAAVAKAGGTTEGDNQQG